MGIINYIEFGGVKSSDYGIYVSGEGTFNAPERDVELIEIPGRNGDFSLDKGRFKNITVTYPVFNYETNLTDFRTRLSDFRNALKSKIGYQRLEDTFHPDEYRMATFIDVFEVQPVMYNTASTIELTFNCKPQRFLKSGEEEIILGEWGETQTVSGSIATFEAESNTAIKSLVANIEPIQDLNGYDAPWVGGRKNKLPSGYPTSQTKNGVTFTVNSDGTIKANGTATATTVLYLSAYLDSWESGSYILNGCPTGGSGSTYCLRMYSTGGIPYADDVGDGIQFTGRAQLEVAIVIYNGASINGLFKPMIRLSSESDSTYEPYENICPISGWSGVNVGVSGVNVWDEEWIRGIMYSNGSVYADGNGIISKNFCPCRPNTQYYSNQFVCWYDINKTFISRVGAGAKTSPSNAYYFKITTADGYGTTYKNDIVVNYPSTDTSYHPYQGLTITKSLGRTVYGGTLDLISGVLTVDRGIRTFDGSSDENWRIWTGPKAYYVNAGITGYHPNWMASNQYRFLGAITATTMEVGTFLANSIDGIWNGNISFKYDDGNDLEGFKALIASNPIQVAYELKEPQTYQLTPEQIETLLGVNNIWADSGEVSVEYGADPNDAYNPTPFSSRPLIETEGHGLISINGQNVNILPAKPLGYIPLWVGTRPPENIGESIYLDFSKFNTGDKFYLSAIYSVNYYALEYLRTTQGTGTSSNADFIVNNATISFEDDILRFDALTPEDIEFTIGTEKTVTTTFTINTTNPTLTISIPFSIHYIPSQNVITLGADTEEATSGVSGSVEGYSSVVIETTTYIDCEIGEAYYLENGEVISANNSVSLPAILPELKAGNNPITHDDTITELKIVPRYWKI